MVLRPRYVIQIRDNTRAEYGSACSSFSNVSLFSTRTYCLVVFKLMLQVDAVDVVDVVG